MVCFKSGQNWLGLALLQRRQWPSGTSVGCASHHCKESDCKQHRRNKRGERNSNHDALATAARITRLSLCHVRTAQHERLVCPRKCVHTAFRLGGNHVASQFGLPRRSILEQAIHITYCCVVEFHAGSPPPSQLLQRRNSIGLSQMSCV